jgi:signal transduction histidine kinase
VIPADQVVPGDVLHLRVGDIVPADVQLSDGQIEVDQAQLTGESLPIEHGAGSTVYAGSLVSRGEATGLVTATGEQTTMPDGVRPRIMIHPATQSKAPREERRLSFSDADRYLLVLRWATIGASVLLALFSGTVLNTLLAQLAVVIVINVPLSAYAARRRPFSDGQSAPILVVDAAQALVATLLAGGAHSPLFPLLILLAAELAIAFPVRLAGASVLTVGGLYVAAVVVSQQGDWAVLAAYMAVGKLLVLLIVGALAIAFADRLRHDEQDLDVAEQHAAQLGMLNELFFELNQLRPDLSGAFQALLGGARQLLRSDVGIVILCDPTLGCWRMTASLGRYETLGGEIMLSEWGWQVAAHESFTAGPAYGLPLPPGWPDPGSQAVVGIRLATPTGGEPGALVVGRTEGALDDTEWLTLRALAREAELSLRNAQLYALEHAQLAQLRQFEDARRSFFSAVAHELRTPLTVLKTLLPSLGDWPRLSVPQQGEVRDMVDQNLQRLELLITEILESSQVEAGAVILHREPVDLAVRAERVVESLRPLFESRQQQVSLDVAPDLPRVDGDRRRVDQILSSLLHNAYKFSPVGGSIRGVLAHEGGQVRMCIQDDGPSVPAEARERIFDKFYSLPAQSTSAGVGLGLYICREFVALHGGRLWYEARPEGGSRFCFTLPASPERPDGEGDDQDPDH